MITVNGVDLNLPESRRLSDFLTSQGYNKERVVVQLNQVIIPKKDHQFVTLKNEDALEILHFVGGG
ncbi:MAG: sulfur carrier protein ThiS [Clostridiales Family XIII bacterium]|jgi:thiamine biosynthesis protein ThiS|nr:sulfur carrier protein ThiS [Clostridiales Family XIII bacterium]